MILINPKKCGGCGRANADDLKSVQDKKQNNGYLCSACQEKYAHLLTPESTKRFWMCGECGFRILAGTAVDAAVDPGSLCPNCRTDMNFSLVNLSGNTPVKTDIFGYPIEEEAMPDKPCILCGKEVHAFMGSKTVFVPAPRLAALGYGDSYAYCGCGGSSDAVQYQIRSMSEEQKSRSLVERRMPK